jgi:hypothetical protein
MERAKRNLSAEKTVYICHTGKCKDTNEWDKGLSCVVLYESIISSSPFNCFLDYKSLGTTFAHNTEQMLHTIQYCKGGVVVVTKTFIRGVTSNDMKVRSVWCVLELRTLYARHHVAGMRSGGKVGTMVIIVKDGLTEEDMYNFKDVISLITLHDANELGVTQERLEKYFDGFDKEEREVFFDANLSFSMMSAPVQLLCYPKPYSDFRVLSQKIAHMITCGYVEDYFIFFSRFIFDCV